MWVLLAASHEADPERTCAWYLPEAAGKAFQPSKLDKLWHASSAVSGDLHCMHMPFIAEFFSTVLSNHCMGVLQEEERERRMDYIPDESAINVENIEVSLMLLSEAIWLAVCAAPCKACC